MPNVTLADLEKTATTSFERLFYQDILRKARIFPLMPMVAIPGLRVVGKRWASLPTIGRRKLNAAYTPTKGTTEDVEETLSIYGGEINIDRVAANAESEFQNQLALQLDMIGEAFNYTYNKDLIQGDHGVDPDGFEGLSKRLSNMPARYDIDLESGGISLNVLASTANAQRYLNALHAAVKFLDGRVSVIIGNERSILGFGQALRFIGAQHMLSSTKDNWDRTWDMAFGAKLVDVGYTTYESTTEIISNTFATQANASHLYLVRLDERDGLSMIHQKGQSPKPYDPLNGGESDTKPAYVRRVDFAIGLKNFSRISAIVRVKGFTGFEFA